MCCFVARSLEKGGTIMSPRCSRAYLGIVVTTNCFRLALYAAITVLLMIPIVPSASAQTIGSLTLCYTGNDGGRTSALNFSINLASSDTGTAFLQQVVPLTPSQCQVFPLSLTPKNALTFYTISTSIPPNFNDFTNYSYEIKLSSNLVFDGGIPNGTTDFKSSFNPAGGLNSDVEFFKIATTGTTLQITTKVLPNGTVGSAYPSTTVAASGGTPPYTWSATGLPNGLSIASATPTTAVISGTPTAGGNLTVNVQVKDSVGATASSSLPLLIANSCGVTIKSPFRQFDTGWGGLPYDHTSKSIAKKGCGLTSLTMALQYAGIQSVTVGGAATSLDPKTLNSFMNITDTDYSGSSVNWGPTTVTVGNQFSKNLQWVPKVLSSSSPGGAAQQFLDNELCASSSNPNPSPVIVAVPSPTTGLFDSQNMHFVLVTGKQGDTYTIIDPDGKGNTLADSPYNGNFITRGYVRDPLDSSQLNVALGTDGEVLVTSPTGARTGYDPVNKTIVEEIPSSAHYVDSISDDEQPISDGLPDHVVNILNPVQGTYTILISGLSLGVYTLAVDIFSPDGTLELDNKISGIASSSSTSEFTVVVAHGVPTTVLRKATFASTVTEINNSLQLGLIDGSRLSEHLVDIIERAAKEDETERAREILRKFKDEVRDRTPRGIDKVAAQILLDDADSLLSQIPKRGHGDDDSSRDQN
jgi:hypothetical protein